MATVAQIRADLVGSSASFREAMISGQRQAVTSLGAIRNEVKTTAESITSLSKAAAGFVGFEAIKTSVGALLDAQKAAQQIHYTLQSATGSTSAANQAYGQVAAIADRLGLSLQGAEMGFAQMSAAAQANGIGMKDQLALFTALASASTTLHLSSDQSSEAILALSQMFSKGKIQAQELTQQLGNAIPGVVPRFQKAVLAMTQGTDLAGKSFDQLLQAGDLSVTRFLPALVSSISVAGAGAEQAATGLNAQLNRVSTAWFKLKSDVSGGLFSDVATSGAALLASNLEHVAAAATAAGLVLASRYTGRGVQTAVSAGTDFLGQNQQQRTAAQASAEAATAQVAQAQAAQEAALRSTALNEVWANSAMAAKEAAEGARVLAYDQLQAAEATLEHQRGAATLSANIRAERDATVAAAAAHEAYAAAVRSENTAVTSAGIAAEKYVASQRLVATAAAEVAVATEAEAAAQTALSATMARTSAAGLLARGASSLGNFALGLVGGPWGAAVAAIAAVGYAFYDTQKRAEDWQKETASQVQSLQELRDQVQGATKDFGTLHASMGLGQTIDLYSQSSDSLKGQRQELADLEKEAQATQDRINSRSNGTAGGAFANLFDEHQLAEIRDRIQELNGQLGPTQATVDALGAKLSGTLVPAFDAVKGAIDRLRAGSSLGDLLSGWSSDIDAGIKSVDAARQKVQQIQSELQGNAASLSKKAATDGMTNAQQQQYLLQQGIASIKAQHLSPDAESSQVRELSASAATAIQAGAQKDSADAAKKAATEAAAKAREWKQAADNLNNSLQQTHNELTAQLDQTSKLTPAQKQLADIVGGTNTAYNHASAALKSKMLAEAQDNVALANKVALQQQVTKDAEAYAVVQENLQRIAQQSAQERADSLAGIGQGQQQSQDQSALTAIKRQYNDLMSQSSRSFVKGDIDQPEYAQEVAAYKAQLDAELQAEQANFAARDQMQADWHTGARAALQDYASSAANVAGQAQQSFSSLFSGLEDAETSFVTKGKVNFSSLITSWISDLTRMELRSANSAIFNGIGSLLGLNTGASSIYSLGGGSDTSYLGSGISSLYGGGRASGGPTAAGTIYEVAEGGKPELYHSGGRTYLLSGQNGQVTPAGSSSGASSGTAVASPVVVGSGGGTNVHVNVMNQAGAQVTATPRTGADGSLNIDMLIKKVEQGLTSRVSSGRSTLLTAIANRTGTSTAGGLS